MATILGDLIEGARTVKPTIDDDKYDRFSSRWGVAMCMGGAAMISLKTYTGPIKCFTPQYYPDQWEETVDSFCWITNTHMLGINDSIPKFGDKWDNEIKYYQWTPFILMFMMLLYALPSLIWTFISDRSGYQVAKIVKMCRIKENLDPNKRNDAAKRIKIYMRGLVGYRESKKAFRPKSSPVQFLQNSKLLIMYLGVKLLNIWLGIILILFMNEILGHHYLFGWYSLKTSSNVESPYFPKVAFCKVEQRFLGGNVHKQVLQCVLPINLYNEKVFLILWWYTASTVVLSGLGLVKWLAVFSMNRNASYIKKYISSLCHPYNTPSNRRDFVSQYLRVDGCTFLRLVAHNLPDYMAADIISGCFDNYLDYKKKQHDSTLSYSDEKLDNTPV